MMLLGFLVASCCLLVIPSSSNGLNSREEGITGFYSGNPFIRGRVSIILSNTIFYHIFKMCLFSKNSKSILIDLLIFLKWVVEEVSKIGC